MRVLFGNVLVKPLPPETTTTSGIVLPEDNKEQLKKGTVEAVGSGSLALDGSPIPMAVQVGETVLFNAYAGKEASLKEGKYLIIEQKEIVLVV